MNEIINDESVPLLVWSPILSEWVVVVRFEE